MKDFDFTMDNLDSEDIKNDFNIENFDFVIYHNSVTKRFCVAFVPRGDIEELNYLMRFLKSQNHSVVYIRR